MFWAIAAGMVIIVAASLVATVLRAGRGGLPSQDGAQAEDPQVAIYRDQLASVDADLARGVVGEDDAERLRLEISRRLLDADARRARAATTAPQAARIAAAIAVPVVLLAGAGALYTQLGAPNYPDLPLERRIEIAAERAAQRPGIESFLASLPPAPTPQVDPEFADLIAQLKSALAQNPTDPQGLRLMVQFGPRAGDFLAAAQAQARLNRLPDAQPTAGDWAVEADLLVRAGQGYVSPEAEDAILRALQIDPGHPVARYYQGLLRAQTGRPDLAFPIWRTLLEESAPNAPWVPLIRDQLEMVAAEAGIRYNLPPLGGAPMLGGMTAGPSAEDVEAAQDMSEAERTDMIEGMVARLSDRLATEGGSPQEWAQLIRALGVLGRVNQAALVWIEAQDVFPDAETLAPVRAAAEDAGVSGALP